MKFTLQHWAIITTFMGLVFLLTPLWHLTFVFLSISLTLNAAYIGNLEYEVNRLKKKKVMKK